MTRVAAAKAYVDALGSHDASGVSLHPDCTRVEFGIKTGRNGPHIAKSLERGPQFRVIMRISGFEATVDGHSVTTAEMSAAEKDAISHRTVAFAKLRAALID